MIWKSMSVVFIFKCSLIALGQSHIQDCLKGLTDFLNSSPKMYQSVIIYEEDSQGVSSVVDEISRVTCTHVSTVKVDSSVSIEHPFNQPPSEKIGRPRTLFVIFFLQESFVKKTLKNLERILWTGHDPRLLLISLNDTREDLLLYAWKKQFINVVHLPLIVSRASKRLNSSSKSFSNFSIHQFNPFIDKRETTSCHIHTDWYPNKLKNLHGFSLPVGMLNDPPICNLLRNSTGHVVEKSGVEIAILNFLARAMNFKVNITPWTGENLFGGRDPKDNTKLIGYVEELRQDKFDFLANHRVRRYVKENDSYFDYTKSIINDHYCVVVPVIQIDDSATYNLFGFIIAIDLFIIFLIFAKICYFSKDYWFNLNILSVMLGFSAKGMPKNVSERITLIVLITTSALYSVYFGNELMRDSLDIKNEVEFRELKDLITYNLVPMADEDGTPEDSTWKVLDEHGKLKNISVHPWETREKCLSMLIKHKNVSCLMGKLDAVISLHKYNSNRKNPILKIMKETLWVSLRSILVKKGYPYLRSFNKYLELLQQTGIPLVVIQKDIREMLTYVNDASDDDNKKKNALRGLVNTLIKYFLKAQVIATLAFIVECFLNWFFLHVNKSKGHKKHSSSPSFC